MRRSRMMLVSLVFAVAVAGCTRTTEIDPEERASSTTTAATSTTRSTTTTIPPTTTTLPPRTVAVTGADLPEGLGTALATFYTWVADDRNPEPVTEYLPPLGGSRPDVDTTLTATATWRVLPEGDIVAVARVEGDVILAADEGSGWQIVGADLDGADPWFGDSPRMVLILGSDARPGQDQQRFRADSIHVITAVPASGTGSILGFPRDSFVETPYGEMKLTSLMANRGPDVMVDQMRDGFGIPVEGYVVTGFKGFEELVAEIGSLQIDLARAVPSIFLWPGFPAGYQQLSPQRALELARTRKGLPGGDLTRSGNQGLIMIAALAMIQVRPVDDAPILVEQLLAHTWTDLSASELLQLAASAFALDPSAISNEVTPGTLGRAAGGSSVVFLDPEADDLIADLVDDGLLGSE